MSAHAYEKGANTTRSLFSLYGVLALVTSIVYPDFILLAIHNYQKISVRFILVISIFNLLPHHTIIHPSDSYKLPYAVNPHE